MAKADIPIRRQPSEPLPSPASGPALSLARGKGFVLLLVPLLLCCFLVLAGTCQAKEGHAIEGHATNGQVTDGQGLFLKACTAFRIPPALVAAIARTESDCNPLCITINGKEYRPKTRGEAIRLAKEAMRQKKSVDIGLMQINSWWLRELSLSCETVLEPKNNLLLALWILRQEMRRYGRTWKAVGAYHSKKPARQRAYIKRVQKNWLR